jgi:hypothetical protein
MSRHFGGSDPRFICHRDQQKAIALNSKLNSKASFTTVVAIDFNPQDGLLYALELSDAADLSSLQNEHRSAVHYLIGYVDQCQPLSTMALTQSFGKYVIQSAIFAVARAVAMAFWSIHPVAAARASTLLAPSQSNCSGLAKGCNCNSVIRSYCHPELVIITVSSFRALVATSRCAR